MDSGKCTPAKCEQQAVHGQHGRVYCEINDSLHFFIGLDAFTFIGFPSAACSCHVARPAPKPTNSHTGITAITPRVCTPTFIASKYEARNFGLWYSLAIDERARIRMELNRPSFAPFAVCGTYNALHFFERDELCPAVKFLAVDVQFVPIEQERSPVCHLRAPPRIFLLTQGCTTCKGTPVSEFHKIGEEKCRVVMPVASD